MLNALNTKDRTIARDDGCAGRLIEGNNMSNSVFTNAKLSGTRLSNVDLSGIGTETAFPTGPNIQREKVSGLSAAYEKTKG